MEEIGEKDRDKKTFDIEKVLCDSGQDGDIKKEDWQAASAARLTPLGALKGSPRLVASPNSKISRQNEGRIGSIRGKVCQKEGRRKGKTVVRNVDIDNK